MPRKPSSKPTVYIEERLQKNGTIYVYKHVKKWDPQKRQMVYVSAELLGKKASKDAPLVKTRYKAPKHKVANMPPHTVAMPTADASTPVAEATSPVADAVAVAVAAASTVTAIDLSLTKDQDEQGLDGSTTNISDAVMTQELFVPTVDSALTSVPESSDFAAYTKRNVAMDILYYAENKVFLKTDLEASVPDVSIANKIRSVALYLTLTNNKSLPGIYHDQLHHDYPYLDGMTEYVYHELFELLGHDESIMHKFFAARITRYASEHPNETLFIAYDATIVPTESEKINARWSVTKEGTFSKAIKVMALYSYNGVPLAVFPVPANINDDTFVPNATEYLRHLGVHNYVLVTDNGFMKPHNLAHYEHNGTSYLGRVANNLSIVKQAFTNIATEVFDVSPRYFCKCEGNVRGIRVELSQADFISQFLSNEDEIPESFYERTHYLYLFVEKDRQHHSAESFIKDIDEVVLLCNCGASLNEDQEKLKHQFLYCGDDGVWDYIDQKVNDHCRSFGRFALISDLKLTPSDALLQYRKRNGVEYFFRESSQHTDGATTKVQDNDRYKGKLFVQFYALCLREALHASIKSAKEKITSFIEEKQADKGCKTIIDEHKKLLSWLNNKSLTEILGWFDCIETTTLENAIARARFSPKLTKRDKMFLEKIGMVTS